MQQKKGEEFRYLARHIQARAICMWVGLPFKGSSIKPFKGHDTQHMIYIQKLYESQTHSQGVQTVILVPT